ncbi:MAG: hypothetical protein ABL927_09915, partial [Bdellovibrionales bacterium]
QYVYLQRSLFGEEHPFTVMDFSDKSGEILIAFKVFGAFTHKFAEQVSLGQTVYIDGPYGVFTEEVNNGKAENPVFIAGGIGITPFVSHVLHANNEEIPHLFYANKTAIGSVFSREMRAKLKDQYVEIYSREKPSTHLNVEYGHITPEVFEKYLSDPSDHSYFICGPQGMIDAAKSSLAFLGVPRSKIYSEEF